MNLTKRIRFPKAALVKSDTTPSKNRDAEARAVLLFRVQLDDALAGELDLWTLLYDSNSVSRSGWTSIKLEGPLANVHINAKSGDVAFTALAELVTGMTVYRTAKVPLEGITLQLRCLFAGCVEDCAVLAAGLHQDDVFALVLNPAQQDLFDEAKKTDAEFGQTTAGTEKKKRKKKGADTDDQAPPIAAEGEKVQATQ